MKDSDKRRNMPFVDWLQLMFIYLKLTKQIDWHWGFVLIPFFLATIVNYIKVKKQKKENG